MVPTAQATALAHLLCRLPQNAKQQFNLHKHKHTKWWVQSYLAGVPTLALGGRDDQVRELMLEACCAVHRLTLKNV